MDNTLTSIEDFISAGISERFFKLFRVPLLFYNGPDVKTVLQKKLLKSGRKDLYPFARARTAGFALNETSYKPVTLMRKGLHGQASHDNTLTYKLKLIPVMTTYEVEIYVQDMRSLRELSKRWLFAATAGTMKFTVSYGVGPLDIDVKLDKQLSVPPREGGVTEVKEYVMTANIMVNGYMSQDLETTQAVNELDWEGQVAALGTSDENTQVFLFKSKWPDAKGPDSSIGDTIDTGA